MKTNEPIVTYLCTPLASGIRQGTISIQGRRGDRLKVCVPGAYLFLTPEDVETLKVILPEIEHRPDKGWIQRSPLTEADRHELFHGEGVMTDAEIAALGDEERPCPAGSEDCWFEDP